MTTSIFIKSFPRDYGWLAYCLASIQKFVTGHSEIVVVLPKGNPLPLTKERIVYINEWQDKPKLGAPSPGYYHQMFVKMNADTFTSSDTILLVDSDCVFTRPFDVSEMFKCGKPMLLRRPWSQAGGGVTWKSPADLALGFDTEYDTMASLPIIYLRETLAATRNHIESIHGPIKAYIRSCQKFIEFVTIGNYALKFQPELYHVVDCGTPQDEYPRPLIQNWSWGGITPQIRAKLEEVTL